MTTNTMSFVGKNYNDIVASGFHKEDVIMGAVYLITRSYSGGQVVIAREGRANPTQIHHDGNGWYATLLNPVVQVGDRVVVLEREDGATLRRDLVWSVTGIKDDGNITVARAGRDSFTAAAWVLRADRDRDVKKDKYHPDRRAMVIERLSQEGMRRLGDTGYATSAKEFFTTFDLPKPKVKPIAQIDVEREIKWGEMGYEMRSIIQEGGVDSLRTATLSGRAKVHLAESHCRCKEITDEEAQAAMTERRGWKVKKVHKVECLWCTEIGRVSEVI